MTLDIWALPDGTRVTVSEMTDEHLAASIARLERAADTRERGTGINVDVWLRCCRNEQKSRGGK